MSLKEEIDNWRKKMSNALGRSLDAAATHVPNVIADLAGGSDTVGRAVQGLMEGLGAEKAIYNSVYKRILATYSDKINKTFIEDNRGKIGGLIYQVSGSDSSGVLISRAMASLLNTITSPKKSILTIDQYFVALLHERLWQCRDSSQFIHELRQTQAAHYIEAMNKTASCIAELAVSCYSSALIDIRANQITLAEFNQCNPGVDINSLIAASINDNALAEKDVMGMAFLMLTPKKLVDTYLTVICQQGSMNMSYLPYEEPRKAPNRDAPPMLSNVKVKAFDSPGLAIDNVVFIRPSKHLNINVHEFADNDWPYGKEWREGFIQLDPPFALYLDDGDTENRPEWIDELRNPDITCVHFRDHETDYEAYDEYAAVTSSLTPN